METIRLFDRRDMEDAIAIWNASVDSGEVIYKKMDAPLFEQHFLDAQVHDERYCFVAEEAGKVTGFILGNVKKDFLPGETQANTPGYVTAVFVRQDKRRKGVGTRLTEALENAFRADGKTQIAVTSTNPIQLEWTVPGTVGHDHNNAPGVDMECAGYPFLLHCGFADRYREVAMYLDLKDYQDTPSVAELQQKLRGEGIETGYYDTKLNYDFDMMCDRVHSEYWRKVLRDETAKASPRPILAATHEKHIVGFTGPVDKQPSGRGFFTGICTDPMYEKRGIATVLFNLLMQAFIAQGATFSTLFTGDNNHAQRLYLRTGFRVVRRYAIMNKTL